MALLQQFWIICLVISFPLLIICLQCVDEDNTPVDWFVAYKIPEVKHHGTMLKGGLSYIYKTSQDSGGWKLSKKLINDSTSLIANTLKALYDNSNDNIYIVYNDEPPNRKSKPNKGHNKGVVLANQDGGLWLIHSVPHFPILGPTYMFPRTGAEFGQSFLCISMDLANLNEVGIQLQYNEPEIYAENILSALRANLPHLTDAASNITVGQAPWYRQTNIVSKNGTNFVSFAKSKHFGKDLYADWLAPALESDLYVETWPNGAGDLPSNCFHMFKVNNVKTVTINVADNLSFTNTHDHSKWAVSPPSPSKNWICVGDINRMEHQKQRGGGTVCLNNKKLATSYQKLVTQVESCNNTLPVKKEKVKRKHFKKHKKPVLYA